MYDMRMYIATKNLPGGPIYIQEHELPESHFGVVEEAADARPPTRGNIIGGLISTVLLIGTGVYLVLAL